MDICKKILKIQNGITYDLARAVIGDVSPAINFKKLIDLDRFLVGAR